MPTSCRDRETLTCPPRTRIDTLLMVGKQAAETDLPQVT
jgi:hypothetical protein